MAGPGEDILPSSMGRERLCRSTMSSTTASSLSLTARINRRTSARILRRRRLRRLRLDGEGCR